MEIDQRFIDNAIAEAPHLELAMSEIMAHENLFDDVEAGYDDDGKACLWVESVMPYPGPVLDNANPEDGWSAVVYADQAEVRRIGKTPSGLDMIVATQEMSLGAFLDLLNQIEWDLGCRAGIFNASREVNY